MRIVIPGGTGQLGTILTRELRARGHEVAVIGRSVGDPALRWNGRDKGPWWDAIDGADAVVNLAGRSVNCRYTWENLNEMMSSRVDSALAVGEAIAGVARPPRVWLQASTASIYPHNLGPAHTEGSQVGGCGEGTPAYWAYSTNIAKAWELALASAATPNTRKVAMRLGFVMSPDQGGVFDWLCWLVDSGIGGPFCGGEQYVGWIADRDLGAAVAWLLEHDEVDGVVNLTAPGAVPNHAFMRILRRALGQRIGLPILRPMAELGAVFLHTDTELMRKSRRALPQRLLDAGFAFRTPTWELAAPELVARRVAARVAA